MMTGNCFNYFYCSQLKFLPKQWKEKRTSNIFSTMPDKKSSNLWKNEETGISDRIFTVYLILLVL